MAENPVAELPVLETRLVRLDALAPHPNNYNYHPVHQLEKLAASLTRFGQVKPIVVQEQAGDTYLLVAGHGVSDAARTLEWETIEAKIIPASWSELEVEGYLFADNFISATAEENQMKLAAGLERQQQAGKDLSSIGYTSEALDRLISKTVAQQEFAINKAAQLKPKGEDVAVGGSKMVLASFGNWQIPISLEEKVLIDRLVAYYKSLNNEDLGGFVTWLCLP